MHRQAILTQLGYSVSENTVAQLERVIANTVGFEHVEKHLITLHDALKPYYSFVALSSTKDYFKIKNESLSVIPSFGGVSGGRGGFFCFRMLMISQGYAMALREGQSVKPRRTANIRGLQMY